MKLRDVNTKKKVMISKEKIPFLNIHPISIPHHTLQLPQVFERVGVRVRGRGNFLKKKFPLPHVSQNIKLT